MLKILEVLVCTAGLAWVLFIRRPNANRTLSASRWMLLAWGLLLSFFLFSPIEYFAFEVSIGTVLYSLIWVAIFLIGDRIGLLLSRYPPRLSGMHPYKITDSMKNIVRIILILSIAGAAFIGVSAILSLSSGVSYENIMSELRVQLTDSETSISTVIAVILALCGLVGFLINLSYAILSNAPLSMLSWGGLLAYLSVYIFRAGRQGIAIAVVGLVVTYVACRQFVPIPYKHSKALVVGICCILLLSGSYFVLNTITRSTGGSMDMKIAFQDRVLARELDKDFRESLRPWGAVGDTVIELFSYYTPQLYGLDYSIKHPTGIHSWGALHFAYFARRLDNLLGTHMLGPTVFQAEERFEAVDLSPHFFRTAIDATNMDFGLVLGLVFVFLCGFLAGRSRRRALQTLSPYHIALQGFICAGCFMTIIYSPFMEIGWAYPFLAFLAMGLIPQLYGHRQMCMLSLNKASVDRGVDDPPVTQRR